MKHPHYDTVHTIYQVLLWTFIWNWIFMILAFVLVAMPWIRDGGEIFWGYFLEIDRETMLRTVFQIIVWDKLMAVFFLLAPALGCHWWMRKFGRVARTGG
jgi:hypothetical protein